MLTLNLSDFMVEFKDGVLKHVGPSDKAATVKLFDVTDAEAREFGDKRVKFVYTDDEGNEVQVALFPEDVEGIEAQLSDLREGTVLE